MTPWRAPAPPTLPDPRARRARAWADRPARFGAGLALIMLGVAATNFTSTYSLLFLVIGPSLHLLGWLVLPGALWRRMLVLLPCLLAGLVLLSGPDFTGAFAALLAGWLFVRERPPLSYLALLPPVLVSFLIKAVLDGYGQNWVGYLIGTVTVIASAWLAWWLAGRVSGWSGRRNISAETQQI